MTPAAPRNVSMAIGVFIDSQATDNSLVTVTNNKIEMKGVGDATQNGDFGVIGLSGKDTDKNLDLSITKNSFISDGDSGNTVVIYATDDDDDPVDNQVGDNRSSVSLVATDNEIKISGKGDLKTGVAGGTVLDMNILPVGEKLFYLEKAIVSRNNISIDIADGAYVGISLGMIRQYSLIDNNLVNATSPAGSPFGIVVQDAEVDIINNTLNLAAPNAYIVIAIAFVDESFAVNYLDKQMGRVVNNIINLDDPICKGVGIYEAAFSLSPTPEMANLVSPTEVKNNDIYFGSCTPQRYYINQATPMQVVLTLDDLNNKTNFDPNDISEISGNIADAPDFIDLVNGNLQLNDGSPCIYAGLDLDGFWYDLLGSSRPQGGGFDIGAYEK